MSGYKKRRFRNYDGQNDVFPFKLKDFEEMVRICKVRAEHFEQRGRLKSYRIWRRNYVMLVLGVNLGCRIEVLLQLIPKCISGGMVVITEFKTGKKSKYEINEKVTDVVFDFIEEFGITENEYIFRGNVKDKPITRQNAYLIINDLAKAAGVTYSVGCHSLRKSYARWEYDESHDLVKVQRMLGHVDPAITLRYICMEDHNITKARRKNSWGII